MPRQPRNRPQPAVLAALLIWAGWLLCLGQAALAEAHLALAQKYVIRNWQTEDGLADSSVTAMAQTDDGYLWLGTFSGLMRYDGVRFQRMADEGAGLGATANVIELLHDSQRRLWVNTERGVFVFRKGRLQPGVGQAGWPAGKLVRSWTEARGQIFAATFDGLCLRWDGDRWTPLPSPNDITEGFFVATDAAGDLWAVKRPGVYRWNDDRWQEVPRPAEVTEAFGLAPARDGGVWIYREDSVWKLRQGTWTRVHGLALPGLRYWGMREDSSGRLWVYGFEGGLVILNPDGTREAFTQQTGLTRDSLRMMFEDRAHNLWLGANGGGLMRFRERRLFMLDDTTGLPERVVNIVHPTPDGDLLIGTQGAGVLRWHGGQIHPLRHTNDSLDSVYGLAALQDRRGQVWWATLDGVFRREGDRRELIRHPVFERTEFDTLAEDADGDLWVGGTFGLAQIRKGVVLPVELTRSDRNFRVRSIVTEPRTGELWCGTVNAGLLHLREGQWIRHAEVELANSELNALAFAADGSLWIATGNRGLARWRNGRLDWVRLPGDPEVRVNSLVFDLDGNLWLGCRNGLMRLAAATQAQPAGENGLTPPVDIFTQDDGLPTLEFRYIRQPAAARDREGHLWFATVRGLLHFDPRELRRETPAAAAQIDSVRYIRPTGPARWTEHEVADLEREVKLPARAAQVEIQYTGLNFDHPEQVRFRLRLQGDNDSWIQMGTRRSVVFPLLPAGRHRLEIEAAGYGQSWGGPVATLDFEMQPLWWERPVIRAGGLGGGTFLLGLLGWQIGRRRLRTQRARYEHDQAVLEERRAAQEREAQLQEQLREAQKMEAVGRLAGGIAHDFNNLLQIIRGFTDIVRQDTHMPAGAREESLAEVSRAAERASDLTRQLLAFSRREGVVMRRCNPGALVEESLLMLRPLVGTHIRILCETRPDLSPILADPGQFSQMLLNLAANARDAMPDGGSITVSLREVSRTVNNTETPAWALAGQWIELLFSDTGAGIPAERLGRIFEPFYTTKERGKGTGLGLAVVYGVVQQHRALIEVESTVGVGSTFRLLFPVCAVPDGAGESSPTPATDLSPAEVRKILVVDDEEKILQLAERVLSGAGHLVFPTAGGPAAIQTFAANADEIDLVVLDVLMPGMTGWVVARELRLIRPAVPILFCSGYATDEVEREIAALQRARLLRKPFTPTQLLVEVQLLAGQHPRTVR